MDRKTAAGWAVLITEHDGTPALLGEAGAGRAAVYPSKACAQQVAALMRDTLGDEVQNVSVARYDGETRTETFRLRA